MDATVRFEPQKLFIGLMDFFSILLPGALLTYLVKDVLGPQVIGDDYSRLAGAQGWIAFLFSAYLLGHFIFLVGSLLLDDRVYDPIRQATSAKQFKRLSEGRTLSPTWARWLAALLFKKDVDAAVNQVEKIKGHHLDPLNASSTINAFQWSKAALTLKDSPAMATVQRFEADSKFFRSLIIVLLVLVPWALFQGRPTVALLGGGLMFLAFLRYVDQRLKATNQAYWYAITLESQQEGGFRQSPTPSTDSPSHAGGVVLREHRGRLEYLLVQATDAPHPWVLPKGHVKEREPTSEAAVREVREETGVWARIIGDLRDVSYKANGEPITVRFFLMQAIKVEKPTDKGRGHAWLSLEEALRETTHPESQQLLREAGEAAARNVSRQSLERKSTT